LLDMPRPFPPLKVHILITAYTIHSHLLKSKRIIVAVLLH
jgi:hypothetical protein